MLRGKKQASLVAPENLVRIVLGVLVFFAAYNFLAGIGKQAFASAETFTLLTNRMNRMASEGIASTSVSLDLEDDSALLIFPENAQTATAYRTERGYKSPKEGTGSDLILYKYEFQRPEQCREEENCVCLCKKIKKSETSNTIKREGITQVEQKQISIASYMDEYTCGTIDCRQYPGSKFQFNKRDWYFMSATATPAFIKIEDSKKLGSLRIQKYQSTYVFCLEFPCIDEEHKGRIQYGVHWDAVKSVREDLERIEQACSRGEPGPIGMVVPDGYTLRLSKLPSLNAEDMTPVMQTIGIGLCEKPAKIKEVTGNKIIRFLIEKKGNSCCLNAKEVT